MSDPIVSFDEAAMRGELKELVRRTVEDTLNALLEEEADDPDRRRPATSGRQGARPTAPATTSAGSPPPRAR